MKCMQCKKCDYAIAADINSDIWGLDKKDVVEYFGQPGDCMVIMKDKRIICECDNSLSTIRGADLTEDGEFVLRQINDEYSNLGDQYNFMQYSEYLGRWVYRRVEEDTPEISMGVMDEAYNKLKGSDSNEQ